MTVIVLSSCGKSKEEIALEKVKLELEKTRLQLIEKTDREIKLELEKTKLEENKTRENELKEERDKIHQQKMNVGKRKKITELNLELQKLPKLIKEATYQLKNVQEFQIGRFTATRDAQVLEAKTKLDEITNFFENLKDEIAQLEYHKTFNFQKSPSGILHYIFESCKTKNFENFKYLCDPYAENESDIGNICYANILLDRQQNDLAKEFEDGRIIGEAKIKKNKAQIEFAFGEGTKRLGKAFFIQRNELWYLHSFE